MPTAESSCKLVTKDSISRIRPRYVVLAIAELSRTITRFRQKNYNVVQAMRTFQTVAGSTPTGELGRVPLRVAQSIKMLTKKRTFQTFTPQFQPEFVVDSFD